MDESAWKLVFISINIGIPAPMCVKEPSSEVKAWSGSAIEFLLNIWGNFPRMNTRFTTVIQVKLAVSQDWRNAMTASIEPESCIASRGSFQLYKRSPILHTSPETIRIDLYKSVVKSNFKLVGLVVKWACQVDVLNIFSYRKQSGSHDAVLPNDCTSEDNWENRSFAGVAW